MRKTDTVKKKKKERKKLSYQMCTNKLWEQAMRSKGSLNWGAL